MSEYNSGRPLVYRRPVSVDFDGEGNKIAVICDDGSVFMSERCGSESPWQSLPPIPGTEAAAAQPKCWRCINQLGNLGIDRKAETTRTTLGGDRRTLCRQCAEVVDENQRLLQEEG